MNIKSTLESNTVQSSGMDTIPYVMPLIRKRNSVFIKSIEKGEVMINDGIIVENSKNISIVEIDLKSKYCDVSTCTYGKTTEFHLFASERSCHIDLEKKGQMTIIELPQFKGYNAYLYEISRYTLRICFIKNKA